MSGIDRREKTQALGVREEFDELFRNCGLVLTDEQMERFWAFHRLLIQRNDELDLTRIRKFRNMVLKHYVDSALIASLTDPPSPLLDIGTGAGFPGLPLKIVRPDLEIILAEGRAKRLQFLEEAIETLGLTGMEVYPHKVTPRLDRPVRGVITRDLEAMDKTLERARGFLPQGGRVLFMKGPAADQEIADALERFPGEFRLIQDEAYLLPGTGIRRRLCVFEFMPPVKVAKTGPDFAEIASIQNPKYKVWQKLADPRGIRKNHLALMSGPKQVQEVLREFPEMCSAVIEPHPGRGLDWVPPGVTVFHLRPELFRELDLFGAGPPLLVVKADPLPVWTDEDWPGGCTLFAPFQDPSNVGAVIRTAAGLGAARVVLLKEAAHPFHPKSLRAAGPAVFRLPLFQGPALADLASAQVPLFALGADGTDLARFSFPKTFGLAVGLEGPGLPPGFSPAAVIGIPMSRGVESINAAAAATVALFEWRRQKTE